MTSVTDLSRTTLLDFRALGGTFHHKFSVITSHLDARLSVFINNGIKLLCCESWGRRNKRDLFSGGKSQRRDLTPKRRFVVQCYSETWTTSDDLRLRRVGVGGVHRGELLLPAYYLQAQKTPQWTHSSSKPDRAGLLSAPPANI